MKRTRKNIYIILLLSLRAFASSPSLPALQKITGDRFIIDLRYRTKNNFLGMDVYSQFKIDACYVLPEVHKKLESLVPELRREHLKIVFWDCFRPLSVQRQMWKLVPDTRYVADPKRGSLHNRGAAIDITLAHEDGSLLEMPTSFDSFEPKAHRDYRCVDPERNHCENRELLTRLMKSIGMEGIRTEWWHFQLPGALRYSVRESLEE